MTTSWLIDSNVLVYAYFHKPGEQGRQELDTRLRMDSRALMTLAAQGRLTAVVAQQNLLEFLAVVTSPKRVTSPVSLSIALNACEAYLSFCSLVNPKPSTYLTFQTLTTARSAMRERLFDLYLGATALDNDITQICTWNAKHYKALPGLTAVTPPQVIKSLAKL
jgi:predicted nucleic acid-binding protein